MTFVEGKDESNEQSHKEYMNYIRFAEQQWLSEYPNKIQNSFYQIYENQMKALKSEYLKKHKEYNSLNYYDDDDHYNFDENTEYIQNQIFALSEMNIIYIFKEFEINLKFLLKKVYGIDGKELYNWDKLKDYLKSKNIPISEINGFEEVRQLKELNNHIKHSNKEISKKIEDIKEFKGENILTEEMINKFFKRIKSSPTTLINGIVNAIYDNLYKFDEGKIKQMAEEVAKTMDKKDAKLYWEEIQKYY